MHYGGLPARLISGSSPAVSSELKLSALHQQKKDVVSVSFVSFVLLSPGKKDRPLKFWFIFFISGDDAMKSNELKI